MGQVVKKQMCPPTPKRGFYCFYCKSNNLTDKDFYIRKTGKRAGEYMNGQCKSCSGNLSRIWKTKNQSRRKVYLQKYNYNVCENTAHKLLSCTICEICHRSAEFHSVKINTDHCHSTGIVRGRLCTTCNRVIGLMQDSTELLENMIKYLKRDSPWAK